jgi:hypothetical protein
VRGGDIIHLLIPNQSLHQDGPSGPSSFLLASLRAPRCKIPFWGGQRTTDDRLTLPGRYFLVVTFHWRIAV